MAALDRIADSPVVEKGARLGYAMSGLLHLMIGVLALRLALGDKAHADQSGALAAIAANPLGFVVLVAFAVGFALLAVWQVFDALRARETKDRLKPLGKAIAYASLALASFGFLAGRTSSSARQAQDVTGGILALPAGVLLMMLLAAAVAGIGVYHIVKGVKKGFLKDLTEHPAPWIQTLGQAGYVAKGLALVAVALLFGQAALTASARRSTGLDGALALLLSLPAGAVIVAAIGVGFAAFGVYLAARARYARV